MQDSFPEAFGYVDALRDYPVFTAASYHGIFPWDACQATNFFIRPLLWAVPTSSPTRPFTGGPAHAALNGLRKNIELSDNNRYFEN
jgi:hypothetical protein